MKFIFQFILVAVLTYLAQLFLPWWSLFLSAGLAGLVLNNKGPATFLAGFMGVAMLWFVQAYRIDIANESILSGKIAQVFTLNSAIMLILVTALIGGISGGFAALTGKYLGGLFEKKKETHSVYS